MDPKLEATKVDGRSGFSFSGRDSGRGLSTCAPLRPRGPAPPPAPPQTRGGTGAGGPPAIGSAAAARPPGRWPTPPPQQQQRYPGGRGHRRVRRPPRRGGQSGGCGAAETRGASREGGARPGPPLPLSSQRLPVTADVQPPLWRRCRRPAGRGTLQRGPRHRRCHRRPRRLQGPRAAAAAATATVAAGGAGGRPRRRASSTRRTGS